LDDITTEVVSTASQEWKTEFGGEETKEEMEFARQERDMSGKHTSLLARSLDGGI
jgi:hypothetical protein